VWGLGTLLYEAATGEPAFDDDGSWTGASGPSDTWDTAEQLAAGYPQTEGPAPSAAAGGAVPAALAEAIDACLAADPGDRSALAELAARLTPLAPVARFWGG
jgi:eukaryotic-like serine/threonine-protein kinase